MATSYTNVKEISGLRITSAAPVDDRLVVNSVEDLTNLYNKTTNPTGLHHVYTGLVVNIKGTSDLYVLVGTAKQASNINYWKKVGDVAESATKIFNSISSLTDGSISFPYKGMVALIDGTSNDDGLYILTKTPAENIENWKKIEGGSSPATPGINFNPSEDFDPNNAPEGLSITSDKSSVVTDYLTSDNTIKDGELYTSQGINSTGDVNPVLADAEYIDIYPSDGDGESYIRLYKDGDNWMNINDPAALGFDNITLEGGEKYEGGDIAKGDKVDFGQALDLDGWTVKTDSGDTYTFGDEVGYDDIDVYKESNLPTAYITVNNITERILTESDMIEVEPESITDNEIENLFG